MKGYTWDFSSSSTNEYACEPVFIELVKSSCPQGCVYARAGKKYGPIKFRRKY
jgi:hypothetical protein